MLDHNFKSIYLYQFIAGLFIALIITFGWLIGYPELTMWVLVSTMYIVTILIIFTKKNL